jgi:putative Holliday junction resolvase
LTTWPAATGSVVEVHAGFAFHASNRIMRILALDHGTVRIGVAVSDELKMFASPLEFIPAEPSATALERLQQLLREKEVGLIVIGMPRNMNGSYGPAAEKVRAFSDQLRAAVNVPLVMWDERLSSVQAHRMLREAGHKAKQHKGRVDASAAAILLQSYLDSLSCSSS